MRTKTLLLSAAVGAAGLVAASAQTVYSVNSVGYINLSVPAGFSMIANQLDNGTGNTVADVLTVPDGTVVFKYDPQTSGGLLAGVPTDKVDATVKMLQDSGYASTRIIGEVTDKQGQLEIH